MSYKTAPYYAWGGPVHSLEVDRFYSRQEHIPLNATEDNISTHFEYPDPNQVCLVPRPACYLPDSSVPENDALESSADTDRERSSKKIKKRRAKKPIQKKSKLRPLLKETVTNCSEVDGENSQEDSVMDSSQMIVEDQLENNDAEVSEMSGEEGIGDNWEGSSDIDSENSTEDITVENIEIALEDEAEDQLDDHSNDSMHEQGSEDQPARHIEAEFEEDASIEDSPTAGKGIKEESDQSTHGTRRPLFEQDIPDETSSSRGENRWSREFPPVLFGMLDPPPEVRRLKNEVAEIVHDENYREVLGSDALTLRDLPNLPRFISSDCDPFEMEYYFRSDPRVGYNDIRARQASWRSYSDPAKSPESDASSDNRPLHGPNNSINNARRRLVRGPLRMRDWSVKHEGRGAHILVSLLDSLTQTQIDHNTTWDVTEKGIAPPTNPNFIFPHLAFLPVPFEYPYKPLPETQKALDLLHSLRNLAVQRGLNHWSELPKQDLPPHWFRTRKTRPKVSKRRASGLIEGAEPKKPKTEEENSRVYDSSTGSTNRSTTQPSAWQCNADTFTPREGEIIIEINRLEKRTFCAVLFAARQARASRSVRRDLTLGHNNLINQMGFYLIGLVYELTLFTEPQFTYCWLGALNDENQAQIVRTIEADPQDYKFSNQVSTNGLVSASAQGSSTSSPFNTHMAHTNGLESTQTSTFEQQPSNTSMALTGGHGANLLGNLLGFSTTTGPYQSPPGWATSNGSIPNTAFSQSHGYPSLGPAFSPWNPYNSTQHQTSNMSTGFVDPVTAYSQMNSGINNTMLHNAPHSSSAALQPVVSSTRPSNATEAQYMQAIRDDIRGVGPLREQEQLFQSTKQNTDVEEDESSSDEEASC